MPTATFYHRLPPCLETVHTRYHDHLFIHFAPLERIRLPDMHWSGVRYSGTLTLVKRHVTEHGESIGSLQLTRYFDRPTRRHSPWKVTVADRNGVPLSNLDGRHPGQPVLTMSRLATHKPPFERARKLVRRLVLEGRL